MNRTRTVTTIAATACVLMLCACFHTGPADALPVYQLSREREQHLGKTVKVHGGGVLTKTDALWGGAHVVGLENTTTGKTELLCVFKGDPEALLRVFEGDTEGKVRKVVTVTGKLDKLASDLPHVENAMVMVDCQLVP